jgi:hypothetical protein
MAIYTKRISQGVFLKKGEDIKDGDLVEIASEGRSEEGKFGPQEIFLVKTGNKEGNIAFNTTTINGIIDAWGQDSLKWIGKKVKAMKIKQNVAGKFLDVWYFAHPDAELTESGFILPNQKNDPDNIKVEDIPF